MGSQLDAERDRERAGPGVAADLGGERPAQAGVLAGDGHGLAVQGRREAAVRVRVAGAEVAEIDRVRKERKNKS